MSFREVDHWIYKQKSRLIAPLSHCCKTTFSDQMSDDIPPQMQILNTVIPLCNTFNEVSIPA